MTVTLLVVRAPGAVLADGKEFCALRRQETTA